MNGVARLTAAETTPGTCSIRASTRSMMAGPSAGAYREFGGRTQNVSTPSGAKPARSCCIPAKLSSSSPDAVSSSTASATSAITSPPSARRRPPVRTTSFKAGTSVARDAWSAGVRPQAIVVATVISSVNSRTRTSNAGAANGAKTP